MECKMNWKKSTAIFGLSACLLTMVVPAMAAEDIKAAMNGTISEDTYTAIEEYFKQNPPAKPDGEADFDGQEPPANPDDKADFNGRRPPQGGMLNADMLQALLDVNVITTDEYNTLFAALPTPPKD